eukprot:scaffold57992_cov20-Tisochrysis_lutea.AAC.3
MRVRHNAWLPHEGQGRIQVWCTHICVSTCPTDKTLCPLTQQVVRSTHTTLIDTQATAHSVVGQEALYCNGADECLHADTRTEARGLLRLCTQQIAEKQVETAEMHSTSNKAEQHCYQWQARLSFIERDLLRSNDAGDGA